MDGIWVGREEKAFWAGNWGPGSQQHWNRRGLGTGHRDRICECLNHPQGLRCLVRMAGLFQSVWDFHSEGPPHRFVSRWLLYAACGVQRGIRAPRSGGTRWWSAWLFLCGLTGKFQRVINKRVIITGFISKACGVWGQCVNNLILTLEISLLKATVSGGWP